MAVAGAKSAPRFDLLTHYYWPPEGTSAIQSAVEPGQVAARSNSCAQIFSLGMTLLHMALLRPLYQRDTYRERDIDELLEETKQSR